MTAEEKVEKETNSSNEKEISDEQLDDVSGGGASEPGMQRRNSPDETPP